MSSKQEPYDPTRYNFRVKDFALGAQMLFVAFGALVLVPILTGLNPNVALFTAGFGTLLFQIITKGKVPIFIASSFAFIAPISYGVKTWGIAGTLSGLVAAGFFFIFMGLIIRVKGQEFVTKLLPPVVTGPVIMVIGLVLAPVAVNMAKGLNGTVQAIPEKTALLVAGISLFVTVLVTLKGKGVLKLLPILSGITAGYLVSLYLKLIDFAPVAAAPWFAIPQFTFPQWNTDAIIFILPVAIAPAIEHVGDVLAIAKVTGRNYLDDPGIDKTMAGDGVATVIAGFLGGPPCTTYSEVTGAVALTKAFNPAIMTWAAMVAIILAFVGKIGAILQTIPGPVMGGIMLLLFGAITVIGLNTLVHSGEDIGKPRNLCIVALILVCGIGGMSFSVGTGCTIKGIGLAGILGVILNLVLPEEDEE